MYRDLLTVCRDLGTVFHMERSTRAVAAAINRACSDAKISQRELAEGAGIPLVTLNRGLNGHRVFNIDELARICVVLGKRPSDLIAETEAAAVR